MDTILEMKNVSKSFKDFRLENINLTLERGYVMGLIGPNGARKTSVIKLMTMLCNIMVPVLLFNRCKPLKIAIICIVLPMPYIAGEVARIMAERTACTGAEWAALGFIYFVGFLTCLMCYCLTKRNLIRYEV